MNTGEFLSYPPVPPPAATTQAEKKTEPGNVFLKKKGSVAARLRGS